MLFNELLIAGPVLRELNARVELALNLKPGEIHVAWNKEFLGKLFKASASERESLMEKAVQMMVEIDGDVKNGNTRAIPFIPDASPITPAIQASSMR